MPTKTRDWCIFADFAQVLIGTARRLYRQDSFALDLDETVYALDSTTIDLCLELFPWAHFRRPKGAVKLHTQLDLRGSIPTFIHITDGKVHDLNVLDVLVPEPGSFYVMDRSYLDFARLDALTQGLAFFVIRSKQNLQFRRLYSDHVDKSSGLRCDQTILLSGPLTCQHYPERLRRVRFFDLTHQKVYIPDQQLCLARIDHRSALQISLAGRTLLQVDQATDQGVFRNQRERRQEPNLDRHLGLPPRGHPQKTTRLATRSLHNSTDLESHELREKVHPTSTYGFRAHRSNA